MKSTLLTLCFSFLYFFAIGQENNRTISFRILSNDLPLTLETSTYSPVLNDSISYEVVKFYVSEFEFFKNGICVDSLTQKHFLIDNEKPESKIIDLTGASNNYDELRFNIGIDSLTNCAGAMGNDLDPTTGMYWTWQSGYINFKLEGTTSSCPGRSNRFQYHLGGYQAPFATCAAVSLDISNQKNIVIELDTESFWEKNNVSETYEIMSPGKKAVELSNLVSQLFKLGHE